MSLETQCIIKLLEVETTAQGVKRKKAKTYYESPPKQPRMFEDSGSEDDAAPLDVSYEDFTKAGYYDLLGSRRND